MSNDVFEDRVKRLLNESVDNDLGRRRPAPRFEPERRAVRRPAWLLPLAVAATVAIISGGAVGLVHLTSEHTPAPPGGHSVPPSPRHTTPSPLHTTPTSAYTLRQLGDAKIAVPAGWHVRPGTGVGPNNKGWCLAPPGAAGDTSPALCPVYVAQIAAGGGDQPAILVDSEMGFYGNPPQWCAPHLSHTTVDTGQRDFGGRPAEWRVFHIRCEGGGNSRDIEQYVVPTDRSFIAFAPKEDATSSAGLTTVAQHSVLPAQDRPLRLQDYGIVRSVTQRSGGYEISLDRVVEATGANPDPATYDYFVPSGVLLGQPPKVGQKSYVFTNGTTVIQFY